MDHILEILFYEYLSPSSALELRMVSKRMKNLTEKYYKCGKIILNFFKNLPKTKLENFLILELDELSKKEIVQYYYKYYPKDLFYKYIKLTSWKSTYFETRTLAQELLIDKSNLRKKITKLLLKMTKEDIMHIGW